MSRTIDYTFVGKGIHVTQYPRSLGALCAFIKLLYNTGALLLCRSTCFVIITNLSYMEGWASSLAEKRTRRGKHS